MDNGVLIREENFRRKIINLHHGEGAHIGTHIFETCVALCPAAIHEVGRGGPIVLKELVHGGWVGK